MSAQTVITHALKPGTRVRYTGTQSWGPHTGAPLTGAQRAELYTVTVVRPWGGLASPMYVVQLTDGRIYVAAEADLSPVTPVGVSLSKATDDPDALILDTDTGHTSRMPLPAFVLEGLGENNNGSLQWAFGLLSGSLTLGHAPRGVIWDREAI